MKTDCAIYSGHSHSFDIGIARVLGMNAAVVFNHIVYWLRINAAKGHNIKEEKVWMYEKQQEIADFLEYLSLDDVKKAMGKLIEAGLLIKENFNSNPFDKTGWYTTSDQNIIHVKKTVTKVPNGTIGRATRHDPKSHTAPSIYVQQEHQEEQQQQNAAAASFSMHKKKEAKEELVYPCLLDLALSKDEMIQITRSNTEDRISDGVKLAKSKKKPPKNLGAFIVWAAADGIKAPESDEDNFRGNLEFARKIESEAVAPKGISLEVLSKHIEIVYTSCSKQPICLYYNDHNFKIDLKQELTKNKFRIKNDAIISQ